MRAEVLFDGVSAKLLHYDYIDRGWVRQSVQKRPKRGTVAN